MSPPLPPKKGPQGCAGGQKDTIAHSVMGLLLDAWVGRVIPLFVLAPF